MIDLTSVPDRMVSGDNVVFYIDDYDRLPANGWTYKLALVMAGKLVQSTATADGTRHKFDITAPDAGSYKWQLYATQSSKRTTIAIGETIVDPNFDTVGNGGYDARSQAEKTLAAIEATIAGRASKDQKSYQIEGRALERTPIPDLILLRDRYAGIVKREKQAQRVAQGLSTNSTIRVRFPY